MSDSNERKSGDAVPTTPFHQRLKWFLTKSLHYVCISAIATTIAVTWLGGVLKGEPSAWQVYMTRLNEAFAYLTIYIIGGFIWCVFGWPWKKPKS
ncbi:hypothetical protein [Pseudomonas aeruginosa]|uniref:hypothetical protein n=1 Tax=Pseudomonas aeruginosa TaxID=287 RepID=UPI003D278B40